MTGVLFPVVCPGKGAPELQLRSLATLRALRGLVGTRPRDGQPMSYSKRNHFLQVPQPLPGLQLSFNSTDGFISGPCMVRNVQWRAGRHPSFNALLG